MNTKISVEFLTLLNDAGVISNPDEEEAVSAADWEHQDDVYLSDFV